MSVVAIVLVLAFLAIAIVHAMWGFRIWWPQGDEQKLARTIVGAPAITRMPLPFQCFMVAFVMSGASILMILLAGWWSLSILPNWLIEWAAIILAAGLALHGLIGFTGYWARLLPEEPFRTLNRKYYSPLCLLLALGLAVLISG